MNYGYFDDENKEYVITNPKLPAPWINYLGNGKFGGFISATAGGLTFDGDPSNRRITRYRFNNHPIDRPGRYLYIRDEKSGDYFSPMWQPVKRNMQFFECRHGLSYTKITGKYMDLEASTIFYVPLDKHYEIWKTKLHNASDVTRKIKVFSYVEFCFPSAQTDDLCHWSTMKFKTYFDGRKLICDPGYSKLKMGRGLFSYITTDLKICGFDSDPQSFIGNYNSEDNPIAVENGNCYNSIVEAQNCIGVLCSEITLKPDEEVIFSHILGVCDEMSDIDSQISDSLNNNDVSLDSISKEWTKKLNKFQVMTPDKNVNQMINCWHAYQTNITFDWSRFISFYERGIDRGFGFRDSMQDVLGIMHSSPEKARERIELLLSIQKSTGDTYSVYYPATKKAVGGGRSDDHLWSILSVCNYIKETGDFEFLNKNIAYADDGSGTVLQHLNSAIDFTMNHLGKHGVPDFLSNDWDDSLFWININGGAESVFVFFQLAHAAKELYELYSFLNLDIEADKMKKVYTHCQSIMPIIWDGKWFIRAFTANGEKYGTDDDENNKIHLIPQAWSIISGLATKEQANIAMDNVMKYLYTDKGLLLFNKPLDDFDPSKKGYYGFRAGVRENGGIFFHANTWAVIALAMLGRNDDAYKCYYASLPNRRNDMADLCLTEPYVYSQTMMAPPCKSAWGCTNSWLTGTASWMYYAFTQYILGIRPDYYGIRIDPKLPSEWSDIKVKRICRGKTLDISIKNNGTNLYVNGIQIRNDIIEWSSLNTNIVKVEIK